MRMDGFSRARRALSRAGFSLARRTLDVTDDEVADEAPKLDQLIGPSRNFNLSLAERVRAREGLPAHLHRKRRIEDLLNIALDGLRQLRLRGVDEETLRAAARALDLRPLNALIDRHNRCYPIEANLPIDPRSGDTLELGRRWAPLEPVSRRAAVAARLLVDDVVHPVRSSRFSLGRARPCGAAIAIERREGTLRKHQGQPEVEGEEPARAEPAVEVVELDAAVEVVELAEAVEVVDVTGELPPVPPGTLVEAAPQSPLDEILGAFARAMRRNRPG
jgi:hypothetical protein